MDITARMTPGALVRFCSVLGYPEDSLAAYERHRFFFLTDQVPAARFGALEASHVEALLDAYGPLVALSAGIDHPQAIPDLDIAEGVSSTPIAGAVEALHHHDESQALRFELRIDKGPLLEELALPGPPCDGHFFYFAAGLARWLGTPLPRLDRELYSDPHRPVLITVAEPGILVRGPFLNIASLDKRPFVERIPPGPTARERDAVDQYLALAEKRLNLRGFSLSTLTPCHFLTHANTPLAPPLEGPLVDSLLHLAVIYTATRTSAGDGRLTATYASAERPVTLNLDRGVAVPRYPDFVPRLARWPLGEASREKLAILQTVVSRELHDVPPAQTYGRFVTRLKEILEDAGWHFRVYLDNQIDKHFEQVEKATDFVAGTAKEVSGAVSDLAKSLTESLLGAVGLIAITLIATVLRDSSDITLIRIALAAYALYLLLFQFIYRLGTSLYSYLLLHREAEKRKTAYVKGLREKADKLFEPLGARYVQFWIVFAVTAILFLAVAVGLALAAWNLDPILAHFGITPGGPAPAAAP